MKYLFKILLISIWLPFGQASALTLDFHCITGNDSNACAIGEAQFAVAVNAAANGGIDLLFTNAAGSQVLSNGANPDPAITEIYFDTSLFTTEADLTGLPAGSFNTMRMALDQAAGVSFRIGEAQSGTPSAINPPELPGGDAIGFDADVGAEAIGSDDTGQSTVNGIHEGEFLGINVSTLSYSLFMSALDAGNFNIGIHARAFAGDGLDFSESFAIATSVVPVPASVWLFGSALAGFFGLSRKRKF